MPGLPRFPERFIGLGVAAILVLSLLAARLFQLQVIDGSTYAQRASAARTVVLAIPSERGLVFDRAGRLLVTNVPAWQLGVVPADLPAAGNGAVLWRVSRLTGVSYGVLRQRLDAYSGSPYDFVPLVRNVGREVALLVAERAGQLPGVVVRSRSERRYLDDRGELDGALLAEVLGYVAPISPEELAQRGGQGYLPDDRIGRAGLEASFEAELRGTYGADRWERDANGRPVQVVDRLRDPVAGRNLVLTIDARVQRLATEALQAGMRRGDITQAVTIVMNPQTGEILAMVSLPAYDSNAFAQGISTELYQSYLDDPDRPLRNHAIADVYPPGSTFKLVTGLAALEEGVTVPGQLWPTYGCYHIPGTPQDQCLHDWRPGGFGRIDIVRALTVSSDTFFYQMALEVGVDRLARWAGELGFGRRTGIRLPGEAAGTILSTDWVHTQGRPGINAGELAQAGIGQNVTAVTPLQLLTAYAALANGGHLMRPMIVRGEANADGTLAVGYPPEVLWDIAASPAHLETMRIGTRKVVTSGFAGNIRDLDLPGALSGKTGSAQYGLPDEEGNLPHHSWFVAYVPSRPGATDAELAVITFSYGATTRWNISTEVVKSFLQRYYAP